MRKIIKKIATAVAAVTMMAAMSVSAFAEIEGEDYFMISGDSQLFNVDEEGNSDFWNTIAEDQELPLVDTVETTNTVYAKTFTCAKAGDWQFKILKNGADFGWSFQACIGNPDAAWADNQTQFQVTLEAGDYTVYVQPVTGFVAVIQNQKAAPMVGRYHSRDEDSENYVALTKAAIEADGYSDVALDDAKYQEFINACVVAEGGTPEEVTTSGDDAEVTTPAEDNGEEVTTPAEDDSKETTKAADKEEKDDKKDNNTTVIIIVVVVVVVIIAVCAILMKKKKN